MAVSLGAVTEFAQVYHIRLSRSKTALVCHHYGQRRVMRMDVDFVEDMLRDTFDVNVSGHSPDIEVLRCTFRFCDSLGNAHLRIDIVVTNAGLEGDLHIGFDTHDAAFKLHAKGFHVSQTESASSQVTRAR
jgi:hypothetical protein